MSYAHNFHSQGNTMHSNNWSFLARNSYSYNDNNVYSKKNRCRSRNTNHMRSSNNPQCGRYREAIYNVDYLKSDDAPSWKRRKYSASAWGDTGRHYVPAKVNICAPSKCINSVAPTRSNAEAMTCTYKWDRSQLDDDEPVFMSRDEIERLSPSRKDGIDALRETHLRYSYCAFIQNLGFQLELPQTTIGTAMVLCHRFFVRRSHACHDRYVGSQLISTAAVFLAAKSEETPRPLNNVIRASSEILHKQDMTFMSFLLPVDWFEQYRERVTEAEQMILTTLNFELNVQHPYIPLTSVLKKLGLSQTLLVNLALNLVSEGLRSSLWLQFKPHQIAAGTAYLAAKFLNFDLSSHENIWQEFQTSPAILQEVTQQLMELL